MPNRSPCLIANTFLGFSKGFHCPHCRTFFEGRTHLIQHMRYECSREPICPYCQKVFDVFEHLIRHLTYECQHAETETEDGIVGPSEPRLNLAKQYSNFEVENGRVKCPKCDHTYKHRVHLIRHINYECGVEPKFKCPVCPRKFKHKASVKSHLKSCVVNIM